MGYPVKDLQRGSLYITISLPALAPYQPLPPDYYPPFLLDDFDPKKYEITVAEGEGSEEFAWGLYWLPHEGDGEGIWYALCRDGLESAHYDLFSIPMPPLSMRLNTSIVGLIRVISLPLEVAGEMSAYLDWFTAHPIPTTMRSFVWATSAYVRCRIHLTSEYVEADDCIDFEVNRFLMEALAFAYGEVWSLLVGGLLPRPVQVTEYGVEMHRLEDGKEQRASEVEDIDKARSSEEAVQDDKYGGQTRGADAAAETARKLESEKQLYAAIRRFGLDQKGKQKP